MMSGIAFGCAISGLGSAGEASSPKEQIKCVPPMLEVGTSQGGYCSRKRERFIEFAFPRLTFCGIFANCRPVAAMATSSARNPTEPEDLDTTLVRQLQIEEDEAAARSLSQQECAVVCSEIHTDCFLSPICGGSVLRTLLWCAYVGTLKRWVLREPSTLDKLDKMAEKSVE
jgi:hypothetical protein